MAIGLHYCATAWFRAPRWLWRRRDAELAPVVAGLCSFVTFVALSAASPVHWVPRSIELLLCAVAGAGVAWSFIEDDGSAGNERSIREMQKEITARINGLSCVAVIRRPWATTAVCSVARGLDPVAYEEQKSTLASSFRAPVTITRDTPGRLELRIELEDLLAPSGRVAADGRS